LLERETHLYGGVCSLKIWKADSVNVKGTIVNGISYEVVIAVVYSINAKNK
jgi:hypothetical protein